MNAHSAATSQPPVGRVRAIRAWRSILAAVLVFALALSLPSPIAGAQAAGAARQSTTSKPPAKGKKSKPKGKAKPGSKAKRGKGGKKPAGRKKPAGKKKPPAKKREKKGGAPTYTLIAEPNRVGPMPPEGCAALTVKTFYEVATGPKKTREFPYHPGASTQKVDLTTTFGTLNPAKTKLDSSGSARSSICSAVPGVAVVTVTIPSFEPMQFAKQAAGSPTPSPEAAAPRPPPASPLRACTR